MTVVQIADDFEQERISHSNLEELVRGVCRQFDAAEAVVSIAIVDDVEFRRLNERFLGRKGTSDCLSFDLSDESQRHFEVVVNGEVAVAEAGERGHGAEAEIALYVTHGLLHNLGYDDATDSEAAKMHAAEDDILQQFGYGRTYGR